MSQEHPIKLKGAHAPSSNKGYNPETFNDELRELFKIEAKPGAMLKILIVLAGILFTPITCVGLVLGFKKGYMKFMYPNDELPRFFALPLIVRASMLIHVAISWAVVGLLIWLLAQLVDANYMSAQVALVYLGINTIASISVFFIFRRWYVGRHNLLMHDGEKGDAKWGDVTTALEYFGRPGLLVANGMTLADGGHICTIAGSGGGKTANLFVNAILDRAHGYDGSFYINDIRGELAAICAGPLERMGKRIVVINFWNLLSGKLPKSHNYNPLDLLSDPNSIDLVDDISLIAELLVPFKQNDQNAFFTNSARSVIAGLLLHLICSEKYEAKTLGELWKMIRLTGEEWDNLVADMSVSDHRINGATIRQAANEIAKQMGSPETWSSIVSNALDATSFMRSHALQNHLVSGFNPYELTATNNNTVVFFILPIDKLSSQSTLLRLVTVSMLRSCVRKPTGKNITYLLDETASMGFLTEIPTAMAAYRALGISMWLVFQDHSQIQSIYGEIWESLLANAKVKQYFSLKDNTTLEYLSDALGKTTATKYKQDWFGNIIDVETFERDLAAPHQLKQMSKHYIFLFTGENPAMKVLKEPYYENPLLKEKGKPLYDPNPYVKGGGK